MQSQSIILWLICINAQDWCNHWPRPNCSEFTVEIKVESDGTMKLDEWWPVVEEQLHCLGLGPRSRMLKDLKLSLNDKTQLLDVLKQASGAQSCTLFDQILWACGHQLQKLVKAMLKGKASSPWLSAKKVDMSDLLACPNLLDRHLVRYIDVCKGLMHGQTNISCATDKASVCGLGSGLQNTVFALPDNRAIFSSPQATHQMGKNRNTCVSQCKI